MDNKGKYPPSLGVLLPDYLPAKELLNSHLATDKSEVGYDYVTGLTDSSPPKQAVILDKHASKSGERAVAYVDGSAEVTSDQNPVAQALSTADRTHTPEAVVPIARQAPSPEDAVMTRLRNASGDKISNLDLADVTEVSEIPADYLGTREIVFMEPEQGEPTVPPENAHWRVTISAKSLRSRDALTTFDSIFAGKSRGAPCVVAITNTDATYLFVRLGRNDLGATCYFEAIGKDNKPVKILLR
jgi:hypothetical protein